MELEKQVCSLELAKRLKELGVNQVSIFKWIKANHPTEKRCDAIVQHTGALNDSYDETLVSDEWTLTSWAAFTVAELGELLKPVMFKTGTKIEGKCYQYLSLKCSLFAVWLEHSFDSGFSEKHETIFQVINETEANARAKMLIYLLENKLIEGK